MRFRCIHPTRTLLSFLCLAAFAVAGRAQETSHTGVDVLRDPSWNYGFQFYGGTATKSTPPIPDGPGRYPSSWGAEFHLGRVLTDEHGEGWRRGTLEWDFTIIPVVQYFVDGRRYYMGGLEAVSPRWNFTRVSKRAVPFVGFDGGMLVGPDKFPPGDTSQFNFTVALAMGTHWFTHRRQSVDTTIRLFHLSNAETGQYNPGVPLSIQLMLGYTWY
jgi:hypothetical protein